MYQVTVSRPGQPAVYQQAGDSTEIHAVISDLLKAEGIEAPSATSCELLAAAGFAVLQFGGSAVSVRPLPAA